MSAALAMDLHKMADLNPASVAYVFLHTEGSPGGTHGTAAGIHRYHREGRGWAAIGYHRVVRNDGTVEDGRPLTKMGAGVEGINARSVHVCCTGNGDLHPLSPTQEVAAVEELARLCIRFRIPAERVLGHREVNRLVEMGKAPKTTAKSCPGVRVDMRRIRQQVAARVGVLAAAPAAR
jgi:hypothetical protein